MNFKMFHHLLRIAQWKLIVRIKNKQFFQRIRSRSYNTYLSHNSFVFFSYSHALSLSRSHCPLSVSVSLLVWTVGNVIFTVTWSSIILFSPHIYTYIILISSIWMQTRAEHNQFVLSFALLFRFFAFVAIISCLFTPFVCLLKPMIFHFVFSLSLSVLNLSSSQSLPLCHSVYVFTRSKQKPNTLKLHIHFI